MACGQEEKFRQLERWGIGFTCLTGLLLFFSCRLSGGAVWAILFGAANGSIWETVKIIALPYLCWSIVELCFLRLPLRNLTVAKTAGLYVMAGGLTAFRLLWTGVFGFHQGWMAVLSAGLFAVAGFWVSSRVIGADSRQVRRWFTVCALAMALFIAMFLAFTVHPPHLGLFVDPSTGIYGIPPRNFDAGAVYLDALKEF